MNAVGRRIILVLVGQLGGIPLGLLVGGFVFCFRKMSDVQPGMLGVLEKIGASLLYAVFTLFTFGFPWKNEGGASHENVWPLAAPISVGFGILIYLIIAWLVRGSKKPNQSLEPTPLLVTDRADARSAPSKGVAHL